MLPVCLSRRRKKIFCPPALRSNSTGTRPEFLQLGISRLLFLFMSLLNSPRNMTGPNASHRGIILIALLWVLTALSLLALNLASTVRSEVKIAQASGEAEKAYFYARGALEEALYHLIFPDRDREKQSSLFPYAGGM